MQTRRPWWYGPAWLGGIGTFVSVAALAAAAGFWLELERRGNALLGGIVKPLLEAFGVHVPAQENDDGSVLLVLLFSFALSIGAVGVLAVTIACIWAAVAAMRER